MPQSTAQDDIGEPGVNGEQKSAGSKGRWRVQVVRICCCFFAAAGPNCA